MGIVVVPILEGKVEAVKAMVAELNGSRRYEFDGFNQRFGLTRHASWLAETPMGPVVIALHEGPGAGEFMAKLGASSEPFDRWFADKLQEIHGIDLSAPPPGPMPELLIDRGSG